MKLKHIALAVAEALHINLFRYMTKTGMVLSAIDLELPDKAAVDKLPESQRGWYEEKDGKFILQPDKVVVEDVTGLKKSLAAARDDAKEARQRLQKLEKDFEDIDPNAVREMLKKFGDNEEAQLMAKGKVDEVLQKRTEKMQKDFEKRLAAAVKERDDAFQRAQKFEGRVLENNIRAAAEKAGLHPQAIDDAIFRGRTIFKLDEEGNAIQPDEDGKPIPGKDPKVPFSPSEWLDGMKTVAPHWFPSGGSGGGADGQQGKGKNGPDLSKLVPGSTAKLQAARAAQPKGN